MINCGIKIGLEDYHRKIKVPADFYEILYDGNHLSPRYSEMMRLIKKTKKPFFFHLPTSFNFNGDIYLLNFASKNTAIRNRSRIILSQGIKRLSRFHPKGFIVHSPTTFDFSENKKIIGKGINLQTFSESFIWLSTLTKNIYLENSAEAIKINNQNYFTKPINNTRSKKYGINCLLDIGHLYTTCLVADKRFVTKVNDTFLRNFSYFHISTLKEKTPHDSHGGVFSASIQEFPSNQELKMLVLKIQRNEKRTGDDYYLVCEPSGGSKIHIDNFIKLMRLLNKE